jgi:hypothetical protein
MPLQQPHVCRIVIVNGPKHTAQGEVETGIATGVSPFDAVNASHPSSAFPFPWD